MSHQPRPYSSVRAYVPRNETARVELVTRVRGEFLEMPGLKLTAPQAQRLWGIGRGICERVLGALVTEGFLERTADGGYKRTDTIRQPVQE